MLIEGYDVESMSASADAIDVTPADVLTAADELARQLTNWATRITPIAELSETT